MSLFLFRALFLLGILSVGHPCLAQVSPGIWRLEVAFQSKTAPFHIEIDQDGKAYALNAGERMPFDETIIQGDSLLLTVALYDGYIEAQVNGDQLHGVLNKVVGKEIRSFPIQGHLGDTVRFHNPQHLKPATLAPKYEVTFGSGEQARPAIGIFEIEGDKVTGSFLTSTGDYRFLQGNIVGDSLFLSNYLGNVTLYEAKIDGESLIGSITGTGGSTREWTGIKNDDYTISDPYSLTYLKKGYDKLDFRFPDLNGRQVSLSDERYKNKVTLVEITGSWCPNCMDAALFLKDFKKKKPTIEIIGLSFERSDNPLDRIKQYVERFEIDYPVLYAGNVSEASEKLPALNKVMSYPTLIIVDKKGKVRHIHTGFSGPATGIYYENFVEEFTRLIEKLEVE